MRIRSALALAAAAGLLAVPVASAKHADRAVATAKGNVTWTIALPNPFGVVVENDLRFHARKHADGTDTGKIHYIQTVEGESFEFKIDVTCMGLYDGNRAKIGGVVTKSNDATVPVGRYGWFQVFDLNGGKHGDGPPDRSSLLGFGDAAANEAFCNSPNLPRFGPWDVKGDIDIEP
jgi:hypothetical protein